MNPSIPLPPGYTQDQIVDDPANASPALSSGLSPQAQTQNIPPPPGYLPSQVIDNPAYAPTAPQQTTGKPESALTWNDSDSIGTHALKTVGGVFSGIGSGVFDTAAGASDLLGLPKIVSDKLHHIAGDDVELSNAETAGKWGEGLTEFIMGDAALKGLSLSDKLLQASKAAKVIEDSPALTRVFQAGVRAIRGGTVGGIQGLVKSGGDSGEAISAGLGAGLGNAVIPEAFDAAKAAPGVIRTGYKALSEALQGAEAVIQPELKKGIGQIIQDVAAEHGITVPDGTAVRDLAEHVGQTIKGKASAIYQSIDNALGGQDFKAVNKALDAAQQALREDTGFDHDVTGRTIEHLNYLEELKAQLKQTAIDAGIPPDAFEKADALWRQGSALRDLSAKIRQSTTGLPENLRDGSTAASAANPETISPSKLVPKIHMLRDSGRLSQALTQDMSAARGNDLLRAVEAASARSQDILKNQKVIGKVGSLAAKTVGAGAGLGVGAEVVRHLTQ